MAVRLPLNILSGIVIFGSDYVRRCLLAPPEDIDRNPRGDIEYQSLQAWWKTTFVRKILWITLVLTSLPIHFLYSSIILSALPAYDAYEVMVDERFSSGELFDLCDKPDSVRVRTRRAKAIQYLLAKSMARLGAATAISGKRATGPVFMD